MKSKRPKPSKRPVKASAPSVKHPPDEDRHAVLKISKATSEYRFTSEDGDVVATWSYVGLPSEDGPVRSKLVLKAPTTGKSIYSLYTLLVQGRLWDVDINSVKGTNVKFFDPNGGWSANPPPVIRKTDGEIRRNPGSFPNQFPAKKGQIWLVSFTDGMLELEVTSKRKRHGRDDSKSKSRFLSDHDTTPPPPEPGGETGEN